MDMNYYKKYEPIFGSWHIVREIGEGSFGKVFEIEREDFGHTYKAALKAVTIPQSKAEIETIRDEGMDDESITKYFRGFVEELIEEFHLMSKLKGESNIVSYEDHRVIEHEDSIGWDILIRMELLRPLTKYTKDHHLAENDVINLGIDICKALELCRKHSIVHRDIKPENIFVSESGKFKLGDFGIAKTVEKTSGGLSKKGTYSYMAPEVYKGDEYGASVDIYSLGLVLYRYLNNNRTPFLPMPPEVPTHYDRTVAIDRRIKGAQIPPPANASKQMSNVILKACAYHSADRYSSPTEMREALEGLISETKDEATSSLFISSEMNKAFVFLSDGNWQKADEHFSNVLKQNPKSGRAYLGKLMAELHVTEECALADCSEPFDNSNNYMEATRYGGDELTSTLNGYLETIRERKKVEGSHVIPATDIPETQEYTSVEEATVDAETVAETVIETVKDESSEDRATPRSSNVVSDGFISKKKEKRKLIPFAAAACLLLAIIICAAVFAGKANYQGDWTEWMQELPDSVDNDNYTIEKVTKYRSRDKETKTSADDNAIEGWKLEKAAEKGDFGAWSDWSQTAATASNDREVETETRYRSRNLEKTTSSSSSKSGWTLIDTTYSWGDYGSWSSWTTDYISSSEARKVESKTQYSSRSKSTSQEYTSWSSWSGWQDSSVSSNSLTDVDTRTVYMYCYFYCYNCGNHWHGYGFPCYTWGGGCGNSTIQQSSYREVWGTTPQSEMGFQDWHGTGHTYAWYNGERVFRNVFTPNASKTQYRYRTRSTYDETHYGDWSSYSDSYQSSSSSKDVRTRTVYRHCDRSRIPTYTYQRWGDWSSWGTTALTASSSKQVENTTFYRYRERTDEKTYIFYRYTDWSDWSSEPIPELDNREIETATFYRYKSI